MGRCQIGSLGLSCARRRISGRCAVWLVGLVGATLDRTAGCRSLPDPAGTGLARPGSARPSQPASISIRRPSAAGFGRERPEGHFQ